MIWWLAACTGSTPAQTDRAAIECPGDDAPAMLTIRPFLQSVESTSAWVVWETDAGTGSTVRFGPDGSLSQQVCGDLVPVLPGLASTETSQVHEAQITGLEPGTRYHYQISTGELHSEVYSFRTPALASAEEDFQVVLMGDSQIDFRQPQVFDDIINNGVLPLARERYGQDLDEALAMVLFAGDLVDNGWIRWEWVNTFFGPGADLFASVPLYPVLGNHEGNSPLYFRYFHLGGDEHFYATDYSNIRVISLDSNVGFRTDEQLAWLDSVLAGSCNDDAIDFVFVQLHHPWLSELWNPGETDWSGEVVQRLTQFSSTCGKPTVHFFGHTHGYSRGESRDHQHLMVNVASAGGALDRWGEQEQTDYDEFSMSEDEYGFVFVEVQAGDEPQFKVLRFSQGTPEHPRDNVQTDSVTVRLHNQAPQTPTIDAISCVGGVQAQGSAYVDPEADDHQASHWQVAADCSDWSAPLYDRWHQRQNLYDGVDRRAGADLTIESVPDVFSGCVRVRYRDAGLIWSGWSSGASCP